MDFHLDTMTENGLVALAKAGCTVDIKIRSDLDNGLRFDVRIGKGAARHGLCGLEIVAEGTGDDGAEALRRAVATADTYLGTVPPRRPLPLPEMPARDPVVADILAGRAPSLESVAAIGRGADPVDTRRAAAIASGRPQAGDRVRQAEDVAALSLT